MKEGALKRTLVSFRFGHFAAFKSALTADFFWPNACCRAGWATERSQPDTATAAPVKE